MLQPSGTSPFYYTVLRCFISTGLTTNSFSVLLQFASTEGWIVRDISANMRGLIQRNVLCQHNQCLWRHRLKKAIPFNLALRLRRIKSTEATFNTRAARLTTYLLKRRTVDIPRRLTLQTKDVNKPKHIPFITRIDLIHHFLKSSHL